MHLYLHETLDPVRSPGAHTRYLDELGHVVTTEGNARGSAGGRCVAAWVPVFLTGQWPQIIGFWQMPGGWDGFAEHFDTHPELFHEPLERWYGERSGGFDRVLVGTDYTPTLDDIVTGGLRAPVVLHETVRLRPGGTPKYLDRVGALKEELDRQRYGFGVLGAYEVAFRNRSEAIVVWAFPDFATLTRTRSAPGDFPELAAWHDESARMETANTGVVVRPTSWSPLR
ncbi:hypothetical protein [Streptosporangium saharense]|uniref:NIPSNAP family containing protein n=1 Tax=Streptosporangium saharense TaxID=1706840 RepID=A0A7W7VQL1_9ACTN|nr:hypothetical protein [Streptosporangium saharense]MBB4918435.1 hypothetical protein [Streptosporangium saharense]